MNGDFKHSFRRRILDEARGVRDVWARLAARARVVVVEGNHDGLLAELLPEAEVLPSFRAGRRVFAHGHLAKGVPVERGDALVLGHEHPALGLRDEVGVGARTRCFLTRGPTASRGETLVLPALSPWAAGYDVLRRDAFMSPLLAREDRGTFRAHALAGDGVLDFGELRRLRGVMR